MCSLSRLESARFCPNRGPESKRRCDSELLGAPDAMAPSLRLDELSLTAQIRSPIIASLRHRYGFGKSCGSPLNW